MLSHRIDGYYTNANANTNTLFNDGAKGILLKTLLLNCYFITF